jgi:hypothetical protein
MIRYIHGSEDSLDVDVFYVFDETPDFKTCQEFCSNTYENRNIIVVENGIVTQCFKGTNDEINNALIRTYPLHEQNFPLIVTREVKRDILLKTIRVIRCILSHLSRTDYRIDMKNALRSSLLTIRIEALKKLDLTKIKDFGKNRSKTDIYKTFAFQFGQIFGLLEDKEFYTKSEIVNHYRDLQPYLYRNDNPAETLQKYLNEFINHLDSLQIEEKENVIHFTKENRTFDIKQEIEI